MTIYMTVLAALLFAGLLLTAVQLIRINKQFIGQSESMSKLKSEYSLIQNTNVGFGNRLIALEKKIGLLKTEQLDMRSFGSEDQYQRKTFKQASHLVKMGASIDELKKSCEISHGEAELLAHMNLN